MFTDDDRRTLYDALERSIGHDPAAILMGHLAPIGWVELATKGDIAELRGDVTAMKSELRGEMAALSSELRGEMAALSSELRGEMAALSSELRGDMAGLKGELRGEMRAILPRLIAANVASMIAFGGLILAAISLG